MTRSDPPAHLSRPTQPVERSKRAKPLYDICGTCFEIRGRSWPGQLCFCAASEEHDGLRLIRGNWMLEIVLCKCCGTAPIRARYKFSKWFCNDCFPPIRALNHSAGTCLIPVGWHSLVNGVYFKPTDHTTPCAYQAFSDQLQALFRETGGMHTYAQRLVARICGQLGFPRGVDVKLRAYQTAAGRAGLTGDTYRRAAFADLARAVGATTGDAETIGVPLRTSTDSSVDDTTEIPAQIKRSPPLPGYLEWRASTWAEVLDSDLYQEWLEVTNGGCCIGSEGPCPRCGTVAAGERRARREEISCLALRRAHDIKAELHKRTPENDLALYAQEIGERMRTPPPGFSAPPG